MAFIQSSRVMIGHGLHNLGHAAAIACGPSTDGYRLNRRQSFGVVQLDAAAKALARGLRGRHGDQQFIFFTRGSAACQMHHVLGRAAP